MAKLLLMDDEKDFLLGLSQTLASHSYDVVSATSATEALDLIDNQDFDLLVTDIIVRQNGRTVSDGGLFLISCLRGKTDRSVPDWAGQMPVIAMSDAFVNVKAADFQKLAEDLHVDLAFSKPMPSEKMFRQIEQLLQSTVTRQKVTS